jgi:hypothetical protein
MAQAAGCYQALWRPEEIRITKAHQLIPLLRNGLAVLMTHPETFDTYNPVNGWGHYDGLVAFIRAYLEACERYPAANVSVSR